MDKAYKEFLPSACDVAENLLLDTAQRQDADAE